MNTGKAPLRCVLFDLDGTLLDTAPDLGAAVNHVLISEGFAPLPEAIIRQTTSHGALGLLKAGLGEELLEELGATRLRTALLDHYAANLCVGTRPYEGMLDLIEWLDEKKLPWGIVTNKPGFLTEPLLAALPALGSGLRMAAAVAPIGAIIGEWVGSAEGLGYVMLNANARMQTDVCFAALFILVLLTVLLWLAVDAFLHRLIDWTPE
mgnify:CR=1 FL=1